MEILMLAADQTPTAFSYYPIKTMIIEVGVKEAAAFYLGIEDEHSGGFTWNPVIFFAWDFFFLIRISIWPC